MAKVGGVAARTPARLRAATAALVPAALLVTLCAALPASGAPGAQVAPVAVVAPAATGAASPSTASYLGVACAGTNACVAVGSYVAAGGARIPAIAQTLNGTSFAPAPAPLPGDAATNPAGSLRAVSCWAPGSCLAVGAYETGTGRGLGLAVGVAAGTPAPIATPPLPPGAATNPHLSLGAVSCLAGELCDAAGTFVTKAGATDVVVERRFATTWLAPLVAPLPAGHRANPAAVVSAISCWSQWACTVMGTYVTSRATTAAFAASLSGTASLGTRSLAIPGRTVVSAGGVACSAFRACVALVTARAANGPTLAFALRTLGATTTATALPMPAGHAVGSQIATVGQLGCTSSGGCVAAGSYLTTTGARLGYTDELVGVGWLPAQGVAVPSGVASSRLVLLAASCTPSRACTAVGQVTAASGGQLAVAAAAYLPPSAPAGVAAAQGPGRTATLSWAPSAIPGAGVAGYLVWRSLGAGTPVLLGAASGPAFTDRTGLSLHVRYVYEVAAYADDHQTSGRVSVALVTYPSATAPRAVSATAGASSVVVRWAAPASDGGTAVREYRLAVTWSGGSESVTASGSARSATIGSLTAGVRVTVRVAAVTEAGPGALSAPVSAVPR